MDEEAEGEGPEHDDSDGDDDETEGGAHHDSGDEEGGGAEQDEFFDEEGSVGGASATRERARPAGNMHSGEKKTRLSIGEKRKLLRKGLSAEDIAEVVARRALSEKLVGSSMNVVESSAGGEGGSDAWKDKYYMAYGNEDVKANFTEDSMQPNSGLRSSENQGEFTSFFVMCVLVLMSIVVAAQAP